MNCLICRRFTLVEGPTTVTFERGEVKIVINQVPAKVCPGCGEAYLEEDITLELLQLGEKLYATGEKEYEVEYPEFKIQSYNR